MAQSLREVRVAEVERALRSYEVVRHPDHPLLLLGPDLLAGADGRLLAVYLPTSRELSSLARLSGRLVLSRLALPEHTEHVLVADSSADEQIESVAGRFDRLIGDRDFQWVDGPGSIDKRVTVPPKLRREVARRFAVITTNQEPYLRNRRIADQVPREWWERKRPAYIEADNGRLLLHLEDAPSSAAMRGRIAGALLESAQSDFVYESGTLVGVFDGPPPIHQVLGALPRTARFDHHKLSRAAAFSGWTELSREAP